ncbi:MAG: Ig-like domain-containing protein [Saccharofermentanales bacterium]
MHYSAIRRISLVCVLSLLLTIPPVPLRAEVATGLQRLLSFAADVGRPNDNPLLQRVPAAVQPHAYRAVTKQEAKSLAAEQLRNFDEMESGIDYAEGEIIVLAADRREAQAIAEDYGAKLKEYSGYGFAVLTLPGADDVASAVELGSDPGNTLAAAYPNRISRSYSVPATVFPSDARIPDQSFHTLLNSYQAWGITKGSADVVVAVIDTGIDIDHTEFSGRISSLAYNAYTNKVGISYVDDDIGHGTHVAGIIAAAQGNGSGGSGIAPGVTLLPVKANIPGDPEGSFELSDLLQAIYYAADNGADVINLSLGSPYSEGSDVLEHAAIMYAVDKVVTVVAAAGNDSSANAGYPAAYPEVIAVSSSDKAGTFAADYSNHGPQIDICAPGTAIFSTYPDRVYSSLTGTSMACPMVSGAVALILSINPGFSVDEVKQRLYSAAADKGADGFDAQYGNGLLQLPEALAPDMDFGYFEGDGTSESPYLIGNMFQFFVFNELTNLPETDYLSARYAMTADLNLAALKNGKPAASVQYKPFTGVFDGRNHSLYNYTVSRTYQQYDSDKIGIFGTNSGTLTSIRLEDITIDVTGGYNLDIGALCLTNMAAGVIENCTVSGSITTSHPGSPAVVGNTGGFVVANEGRISGCTGSLDISARMGIGGIAAYHFSGIIENCIFNGSIKSKGHTGGIAGGTGNGSIIQKCFNTADIDVTGSYATYTGDYAGGITGEAIGDIIDCQNSGRITGNSYIGGIAGMTSPWISVLRCSNSGTISASYSNAGGIAGALIQTSLIDCFNTGDIRSPAGNAGGITGITSLGEWTIRNCYNTGSVIGSEGSAGAIAGVVQSGTIEGIVQADGSLTDCYYLDNMALGIGNNLFEAERCSIGSLKEKLTFTGFDFDNVWMFTEDASYTPVLRNTYVPLTGIQLADCTVLTSTPHNLFEAQPSNATINDCSYNVYSPQILTVSAKGDVAALNPGFTQVTATSLSGGFVSSCCVTVYRAVAGIEIPETLSVIPWEPVSLNLRIYPEDSRNKELIWSTSDFAVATVDEAGTVIGKKSGSATITAEAADGGGAVAVCKITVYRLVTGLSITDCPERMVVNTTAFIKYEITPADASNKIVKWTSSDSGILEVGTQGYIKALAPGTVTVTVRNESSGLEDSRTIKVVPLVTEVLMSMESIEMAIGDTLDLQASSLPAETEGVQFQWYSTNDAAASVDQNGRVMALATGQGYITARALDGSGKIGWTRITVVSGSPKVVITAKPDMMFPGYSYTLAATMMPVEILDKRVVWQSADPAVAAITEDGVLTALTAGKVAITATSMAYPMLSASYEAEILVPSSAVVLDCTEITIYKGTPATLSAQILPEDAALKTVSWTSGNNSIATVDEHGVVTGQKIGETVVTAVSGDGFSHASCIVKVTQLVQGISILATETVWYNIPGRCIATVHPDDAINKAILWSILPGTGVATITQDGYVTGTAAGTVTVVATATDGSGVSGSAIIHVRDPVIPVKFNPANGQPSFFDHIYIGNLVPQPADPTRQGYDFVGWYDGTNTDPWDFTSNSILNAIELTARWTTSKLTVCFDMNGGSPAVRDIIIEYGTLLILPSNPVRNGFTFLGWYADPQRLIRLYSGTTAVTSDMTVYAGWMVPSPTGLQASHIESTSVMIVWTPVYGADYYEIYRSSGSSGVYNFVISTPATTTNHFDANLITGTTYKYKIRSCVRSETATIYSGYSGILSVRPVPETPLTPKAAAATYNSIRLSWSIVSGADGYGVYRSTSAAGSYIQIANVSGNTHTDANLLTGTTYYYKISAYRMSGTSKIYGSQTAAVSAKPVIPVPTAFNATAVSYNSIKLTWTAVAGANGYGIYRATSATGTYARIASAAANTYTNINLSTGTTYYYKVNAYRLVGTGYVYSGQTSAISKRAVPAIPSALKAASASYNSIKLTWTAVVGANGYGIYRATSATGTYTLLTNTASATYTNSCLATGTTYYYKINAYRLVGTTKVYGSQTAAISAKAIPATVGTITTARYSATSIKISWSGVSGASGYEIWRSTSSSGSYMLIRTQTALSYVNAGLRTGTTYYYKIRAYRIVGTTKVYGAYSTIKYAKP